MKKLLLGIAAAAISMAASAATYTITPDMTTFTIGTYTDGDKVKGVLSGSWTVDNVTFPVAIYQNTSSTKVDGIQGQNNELRWYKSMIMTIDAPQGATLTKIEFVFAKSNKAATFAAETGTVTAATATTEGLSAVWENANGVTQFKGTSTEGQIRAAKIIITTGGEAKPDTRKDAGLSFPQERYYVMMGETFTAPALTKATTAEVKYASDKETVATVDAATGAVTIVGVGTAKITAAAAENDEYKAGSASYLLTVEKNLADAPVFTLATTMSEGKYVLEVEDQVAKPISGTSKYGYLYTEKCLIADNSATLHADAANAFTFKAVEGGYNILDAEGRYYYLSGNYNSFNIGAEIPADADGLFTVTIGADNKATIYSPGKQKTVAYSIQYKSIGVYPDVTDAEKYALPTLYKETESSITTVEADANAPVEYYNLQGVRIANPTPGLYIRRQGTTATKVLVK